MRTTLASLGLFFGLTCLMGATPVYQDEFACEEALKKLSDCCGPDAPLGRVSCYAGRGCDSAQPSISEARSTRIRELSCGDIAQAGYCAEPRDTLGDMR